MRRSKLLRVIVVGATTAALVGAFAGTALADIKLQNFGVSPTSTQAGTPTGFTLTVLSKDGSNNTTPVANQKPLCFIVTAPGFGNFSFGSPVLTASPVAVTGWSGTSGPQAGPPALASNQFKVVSGGQAIPGGDTVTFNVTGTAPSPGSFTWTIKGYDDTACSSAEASATASTAVTVSPAPSPDTTTTTVACVAASPLINTASSCTATVTDTTTALNPTGSIAWSDNDPADGVFANLTCPLVASGQNTSSCSVNYTPGTTATRIIRADYQPSGFFASSFGTTPMTPVAPQPGNDNTQTVVTCDPASPIVSTGSTCTAVVTDTTANGHPTGSISWSDDDAADGVFGATQCTLANLPAPNQSSCDVLYTPGTTDLRTIFGDYVPTGLFNASSGSFGMTPQAQPQPPGNFQPDELIKLMKKGTHYVRDNYYTGSGHGQRVHAFLHRGQTGTALVEVQNDGDTVDDIVVGGTGGQAGFVVHYIWKGKNITHAVTGHGYTFHLAPDAHRVIKVLVTVLGGAEIGKERTWQILARSTGNPLKRDAAKFTCTVARLA